MASERRPLVSAFSLSLTAHAGVAALLLMYMGVAPEEVATKAIPVPTNLVFIQEAGPGGGGGGRPVEAAPAPFEIPRPAAVIPAATVEIPPDPPPPTVAVPVTTFEANVLQGGITLGGAAGPGGRGPGTGVGDGKGAGVGPGNDKGFGGETYAPGAATQPTVRLQVRPQYTSAALAAKIQGAVTLEVEVLADGTVGTVRVLKSLDRVYGLDQSAIAAAQKWRFVPGTINGKPVGTIVTLILEFNLR